MREMVQVVAWYALVLVIGIALIWIVNSALGVQHVDVNGEEMGSVMVTIHHVPQLILSGALVWLQHKIFGR